MVVGIGETVLDIIFKNDQPQAAVPGGSTFNAVISLGRVGMPCCIVTEVGDDHVGEITCQYLRDNGVSDIYVNRPKGVKSHLSLAFLDGDNNAQYQFYKDHANVSVCALQPSFTPHDIVLFGSFFSINPIIRNEIKALLLKAKEAGAFRYYDINFRASHIADIPMVMENIKENYSLSSVVRGSLEDFTYLYNCDDVDAIYEKFIRPYCPCFICTDGSRPIQVRTPQLSLQFPTVDISTVSTIGAGDNFNAGFLYSLSRNGISFDLSTISPSDWQTIINVAQAFSADVCQQMGNSVSEIIVDKYKMN